MEVLQSPNTGDKQWEFTLFVSLSLLSGSDILNKRSEYLGKNHSGGGQGGGRPGEQGAGRVRETHEEERAGGGISTMAGSGREIQKGQSKKQTQQRFLTSI